MPDQSLPQRSPPPTPPRTRWGPKQLVAVLNGVAVTVTGAYLVTGSVTVTLMTGLLAVALAAWLALLDR